jgi:hypothetical protein
VLKLSCLAIKACIRFAPKPNNSFETHESPARRRVRVCLPNLSDRIPARLTPAYRISHVLQESLTLPPPGALHEFVARPDQMLASSYPCCRRAGVQRAVALGTRRLHTHRELIRLHELSFHKSESASAPLKNGNWPECLAYMRTAFILLARPPTRFHRVTAIT